MPGGSTPEEQAGAALWRVTGAIAIRRRYTRITTHRCGHRCGDTARRPASLGIGRHARPEVSMPQATSSSTTACPTHACGARGSTRAGVRTLYLRQQKCPNRGSASATERTASGLSTGAQSRVCAVCSGHEARRARAVRWHASSACGCWLPWLPRRGVRSARASGANGGLAIKERYTIKLIGHSERSGRRFARRSHVRLAVQVVAKDTTPFKRNPDSHLRRQRARDRACYT